MKRKTMIMLVAMAATAFAACEKESSSGTAPQETVNPLTGHAWIHQLDTTMMGIHIVTVDRYTFLTDSTGEVYFGGEDSYAPWWDTINLFSYTFHPEVSGVEVYIDGSHIPTYFRYFPENQTLTQPGTVFHLVEE